MAEPFDTLLQVQLHDTTLDQLRHRRTALPEHQELAVAEGRRAALVAQGAVILSQVEDLAARQRALEAQIEAAATRRHEIERRMLDGNVSASRDLQAMDGEVHHLADRQSELEEQELALLEEEDPLDVALAANEAAAAELTGEVERLTAAIAGAVVHIDEEIVVEAANRSAQAAQLPADLAEKYETLRSRLGGVGAARLAGNRCDGCHLTLPSVEIERIRRLPPDEFATCDQCGRILVR